MILSRCYYKSSLIHLILELFCFLRAGIIFLEFIPPLCFIGLALEHKREREREREEGKM